MNEVLFIERYGPSYLQVMRVLVDITNMDASRCKSLISIHSENSEDEAVTALEAAERYGLEAQAVRASEDCRREVWNIMWDGSTRRDTWTLSWIAARAGLGAAVVHLVERGGYAFEDHLTLLGPWRAVFGEVEAS